MEIYWLTYTYKNIYNYQQFNNILYLGTSKKSSEAKQILATDRGAMEPGMRSIRVYLQML